ncbi:nucleotide sugar dehydrogenase [Elongatibacter sediminis]|uniref:Nucleotide sugar dehydrogenase n=1 Tax=Elongatibacter sediminis TaxID=3119006 RepID=A0AAW9RBC9_9GAMM
MSNRQSLIRRLEDRSAVVGVIGLGYVGLPLALAFSEAGYRVLGLDIDPGKPRALARGESYFRHVPDARVQRALDNGLEAGTDFSRAEEADALIICVPTPLNEHRDPDLSFIVNTMESIVPHLRAGHMVSLESTTWPGTTEEVLRPRLQQAGFSVGRDVFLAYSPEREDPGNASFTTATIPKVVSGSTPACREVAEALYRGVVDEVVPVSSTRAAEMTKLLENIHRAVNIGLVNEMKIVADRMGIDIYEVIEAAASKPFGFVPYYPGPGLGGHCIPIDPFYLTWKAREYGVNTRFIELAGEINSDMPRWVVSKIGEALNSRAKPIRGSTVLMLGIAYKKNVDDVRESPSVEIMHQLREHGAAVEYHDPYFPRFPTMRRYSFDLESQPLTAESLRDYDCVVIGVDHDLFDYERIFSEASLVVDTRGRARGDSDHIFRA